jgi:nitrogen fixation/metabolism regulation signal transduction histidine kinase
VNRLRNRLVLIFLAATLAPLAATLWITDRLIDESLSYASTRELDEISRSLERVGREFYNRSRERLRERARTGQLTPERYLARQREGWPAPVRQFYESGETERFRLSGTEGDRLELLVRREEDVWSYSEPLGPVAMGRVTRDIRSARELVARARGRDLRRGITYTWILLAAGVWITALLLLIYFAHRISRPIQQLTAGLGALAAGKLDTRVPPGRDDEVGRAIDAFNDMASRLQESTERLISLTQLASWQMLARKMAHEVKNSLTPIRLTVEEMVARASGGPDRQFLEQAAQIVVDEIEAMERRVRAFSQFAAEPASAPGPVDVNAVLEERVAFLKTGHPGVEYDLRLDSTLPAAYADSDVLKGILVNLLENAAEALEGAGSILARTASDGGKVLIEVHDSGPGLSEQARRTLFQPAISFKKRGMGLGLSIARRGALVSGGDLQVIQGELGGAAFRLLLPAYQNGAETDRHR